MSDSEANDLCSDQSLVTDPATAAIGSVDSSVTDVYPPIHSLLLCPAQWTALLESPVSLVRGTPAEDEEENGDTATAEEPGQNGEDSGGQMIMEGISISGDSSSQMSGVIDQEAVSTEGEETDSLEPVTLTLIGIAYREEDIAEKAITSSQSSEENGVNRPSPPVISQTPAHLLPVPLLTTTPSSQGGSSEGSCTIGRSEDEVTRGADTPSLSDRASVPTTPCDSRFPNHFTHSRNVSETPSLPPFVSSSTSSAYHSRNSSMASQITSDCFETDSQFTTDIDSCIVTYSSDFHHSRPISLQEARFKFPEMSAMEKSMQKQCYSIGDLNVTAPIRVPEHLFLTAPPLDETLTTGEEPHGHTQVENFEGKQLSATVLKSSEWIKREMRKSRQTMIQVKVSSKSRHVVHFNVKAGDMFLWEFATKRKDIAFGLSFEATEVATEQEDELEEEDSDPEMKMIPILPVLRVNTHAHPIIGSHTATQDGVYELLFDNSYSRFFAKELYYRITTKPSIPNEHYLHQ